MQLKLKHDSFFRFFFLIFVAVKLKWRLNLTQHTQSIGFMWVSLVIVGVVFEVSRARGR